MYHVGETVTSLTNRDRSRAPRRRPATLENRLARRAEDCP